MADKEHARIKVVVIEDDPIVLDWFAEKLETPRTEVVAGCLNAQAGLQAVESYQPEVALVDMLLDLDPRGGVLVIEEIKARWNQVSCCVVTSNDPRGQYVMEAFHVGAQGYWRKGYAKTQLLTIVERLADGEVTIEPDLASLFRNYDREPQLYFPSGKYKPPHHSPQKLKVLELISSRKSNQEIADTLGISVNTVKTYVHQIMAAYHVTGTGGRYRAAFQAQVDASLEADRRRQTSR